MRVKIKRHIKFERIRQHFGCGYYAVCCGNSCPCEHKYEEQLDEEVYRKLKEEFDQEAVELFGG